MSDDLIRRGNAINEIKAWFNIIERNTDILIDNINNITTVESNLILPERMERGDCYEVGETIVVMNHDDYYDLLCKSMKNEPKQGEWETEYHGNGWNDYWDYTCSNCGKKYERADAILFKANFCPNCGTRMKEIL